METEIDIIGMHTKKYKNNVERDKNATFLKHSDLI